MANNGQVETSSASAPQVQVKGPTKERRGSGIPWFPNFAAVQGKSIGVHVLTLLASKFGLIAALGSVALGSAAVGVTMRNDDMARTAMNSRRLAQRMHNAGAAGAAGTAGSQAAGPISGVDSAQDGMAYIKGGGGDQAGAAQGEGASASAAAPDAKSAKGGEGAKGADGANGAEGAKDGRGAQDAVAAAAAAAMRGGGALGSASAKPMLSKMPSFSNGSSGGGGGGGMMGGSAAHGSSSGLRESVDASVRNGSLGSGRDRLTALGRRTSGIQGSKGMNDLLKMGPGMQGNKTGTEAGVSTQRTGFDTAAPIAPAMTALAPGVSPGASAPASNAGQTPAEGGPMDVSGGNSGSSSNVPDVPGYVNVTPYQWAITLAKMIMLIATVLAGFIAICKATSWTGISAATLVMLTQVVAALGGVLALLGCFMLAMGQYIQGTIWTVIGGALAITALASIDPTGKAVAFGWEGMAAMTAIPLAGLLGQNLIADPANEDASKKKYEEQYGVNPDTNQVDDANKANFDTKNGKGAADNWNKTHKKFST